MPPASAPALVTTGASPSRSHGRSRASAVTCARGAGGHHGHQAGVGDDVAIGVGELGGAPIALAVHRGQRLGRHRVMRIRAEWNVNRSGAVAPRPSSSGSSVSIVVFELGHDQPDPVVGTVVPPAGGARIRACSTPRRRPAEGEHRSPNPGRRRWRSSSEGQRAVALDDHSGRGRPGDRRASL